MELDYGKVMTRAFICAEHTIDCNTAFVLDFAVIVLDDAFVFAMQFGCDIGQDKLVVLAIIFGLEFISFSSNFQTIQIPLNGSSVKMSS